MKNLNKSGLRISLVVNNENKFQGTISDGDIRRALINGKDQKTSIKEIINRNALIVTPKIKSEIILQLMVKNKVQQIPLVDENQKFQDYIFGMKFYQIRKFKHNDYHGWRTRFKTWKIYKKLP